MLAKKKKKKYMLLGNNDNTHTPIGSLWDEKLQFKGTPGQDYIP